MPEISEHTEAIFKLSRKNTKIDLTELNEIELLTENQKIYIFILKK